MFGQVPSQLTIDLLLLRVCPQYTTLIVNTIYSFVQHHYFSRTTGTCQTVSRLEQHLAFTERTCKHQAAEGKAILESTSLLQYNHKSNVREPHLSSKQIFQFTQTWASLSSDDNSYVKKVSWLKKGSGPTGPWTEKATPKTQEKGKQKQQGLC